MLTWQSRYVFGRFQFSLEYQPDNELTDRLKSQYRTIPTFLTLFIFGFLYILFLSWDALRLKNTIQIIGLCVANLAIFVYAILQIDQIDMSISRLLEANALKPDREDRNVWALCKPFLVAVPAVVGVVTVAMGALAYQLYREFAWDILKQIGADYRMKKRFLHYQVSFLFFRRYSNSRKRGELGSLTAYRFISPFSSSTFSSSLASPSNSSSL